MLITFGTETGIHFLISNFFDDHLQFLDLVLELVPFVLNVPDSIRHEAGFIFVLELLQFFVLDVHADSAAGGL